MTFTVAETEACRRLVALALQEDLNGTGDVTSQAAIPAARTGRAVFVARASRYRCRVARCRRRVERGRS